jgi:hypothetical protein
LTVKIVDVFRSDLRQEFVPVMKKIYFRCIFFIYFDDYQLDKLLTFIPVGSQLMNEAISQAIIIFGNNLKSKHLLGLLGIILLSLFWFCAIYLIAPNFYKSAPLFISIIISFLLGIVWFFLNTIISILTSVDSNFNILEDNSHNLILIDAMMYAIGYFSLLLWICYYDMTKFIPCIQIRPSFFFFTNTTFICAFVRLFCAYRNFKKTLKDVENDPNNDQEHDSI